MTRPVRGVFAGAIAAGLALTLAGCITINVDSPEPSTAPTVQDQTTAAPEPDDSAALGELAGAMGALYAYVEKQNAEACDYVAYIGNSMQSATPLDEYRGSYERIQKAMSGIGVICFNDLHDQEAIDLAMRTRGDVTKILNDREFLGLTDWGKPSPIPGAQLGQ